MLTAPIPLLLRPGQGRVALLLLLPLPLHQLQVGILHRREEGGKLGVGLDRPPPLLLLFDHLLAIPHRGRDGLGKGQPVQLRLNLLGHPLVSLGLGPSPLQLLPLPRQQGQGQLFVDGRCLEWCRRRLLCRGRRRRRRYHRHFLYLLLLPRFRRLSCRFCGTRDAII